MYIAIEKCLSERVGMEEKFYLGCSIDMKQMIDDKIQVRVFNLESVVLLHNTM